MSTSTKPSSSSSASNLKSTPSTLAANGSTTDSTPSNTSAYDAAAYAAWYAQYYAQYYTAATVSSSSSSSSNYPAYNATASSLYGGAPTAGYATGANAFPVGPNALENGVPPHVAVMKEVNAKKRKLLRAAGGEVWEDPTLVDWDPNDFRLFVGDLGNDVNNDDLARAFQKFPSFLKAHVVRDKRTTKSKGYGFVSFKDAECYTKAFKEMNGKYVGARPIKLRKSTWKDRNLEVKSKKQKRQG